MKAKQLAQKENGVKPDPGGDAWRGKKVYLRRETDDGFPFEGELDYVDQAGIEADTGTLGLRASFNNQSRQLPPGLRYGPYPSRRNRGITAGSKMALTRNDQGSFVLTVGADNEVAQTKVTVGQTVSGWAIIPSGLKDDDEVIIDGLQRARQGLRLFHLAATHGRR